MVEESGRVQVFNQLVRSIITLSLVAGFLYAALWLKVVQQETFNQIVVLVITWWFVRDAARAAVKESVDLLKTPTNGQHTTQTTTTTTPDTTTRTVTEPSPRETP